MLLARLLAQTAPPPTSALVVLLDTCWILVPIHAQFAQQGAKLALALSLLGLVALSLATLAKTLIIERSHRATRPLLFAPCAPPKMLSG